MQTKSLVQKIYNLAWYDFTQNFTQWFNLASVLAASVTLVILPLLLMHRYVDVISYPIPFLTNIDIFFDKLFTIIVGRCGIHFNSMLGQIIWYCVQFAHHCLFAGLTMILLQNCLDLAFDSVMSGFSSMSNWLYVRIMVIVACMTLFSSQCLRHLQMTSEFFQSPLFGILGLILIFYWSQLWYLQIMHAMEYKKEYWQTYTDFLPIARHQARVLILVALLQVSTLLTGVIAIHQVWAAPAQALTRIMIWPLQMLLQIQPNFSCKSLLLSSGQTLLINFWHTIPYFLLAAWIFLVWAHLYRSLICPPVDNPSCASCTSCSN